ncbi:helix-turn-helix domain-containing protein [Catellatospora methionotrophica]|nr:helix-turn-helix transcriptional regulator [Catellatospora methionotrophica]
MNALLTDAVPRTGSPSRSGDLLRYSFHVSKDDRAVAQEFTTFAEALTYAVATYYDGVDKAFADAAGISSSAVSRYKTGQTPRPETIEKMAPYMHMSVPRLMSLAYPRSVESGTNLDTVAHPLVVTLNQLIGPDSRMPADEKAALEAVITTVLAPYKRHLRTRKTA